jgi:hypothetical protein
MCWYILLRIVIGRRGATEVRAAEVLNLSMRVFARVVARLQNPPPFNEKLLAALTALSDPPKRHWLGATLPSPKWSREGSFPVSGEGYETTAWSAFPERDGSPMV